MPDPLSPTTATVSPGAMAKLTSSTPTTTPCEVSNSTLRFSIETSGTGDGAGTGSGVGASSMGRLRGSSEARRAAGGGKARPALPPRPGAC